MPWCFFFLIITQRRRFQLRLHNTFFFLNFRVVAYYIFLILEVVVKLGEGSCEYNKVQNRIYLFLKVSPNLSFQDVFDSLLHCRERCHVKEEKKYISCGYLTLSGSWLYHIYKLQFRVDIWSLVFGSGLSNRKRISYNSTVVRVWCFVISDVY